MASLRVCAEPGCSHLIEAGSRDGRCPAHRRQRDRARGTAAQRGYGQEHRRLRKEWEQRMRDGERVVCWRCLEERGIRHYVDPDAFDLGHDDNDRAKYRGPECRSGNRATAARRGPGGGAGRHSLGDRGGGPSLFSVPINLNGW